MESKKSKKKVSQPKGLQKSEVYVRVKPVLKLDKNQGIGYQKNTMMGGSGNRKLEKFTDQALFMSDTRKGGAVEAFNFPTMVIGP